MDTNQINNNNNNNNNSNSTSSSSMSTITPRPSRKRTRMGRKRNSSGSVPTTTTTLSCNTGTNTNDTDLVHSLGEHPQEQEHVEQQQQQQQQHQHHHHRQVDEHGIPTKRAKAAPASDYLSDAGIQMLLVGICKQKNMTRSMTICSDCSDLDAEEIVSHRSSKVPPLERVARLEQGLVKHVASFLSIRDKVNLCETSKTLLNGMSRCQIRLDELKTRIFTQFELIRYFGAPNNMTKWDIVGIRIRQKVSASFWDLINLQQLKCLVLTGNVKRFDAKNLRQCKMLETFDAGISCNKIDNIHSLKHLNNLKYLYLRNVADIRDTSFLPSSKKLVELSLYMCRNLESLVGINGCKDLRVLDLGGCSMLRDIDALGTFSGLEQISLADCFAVPSIAPLVGHKKMFHVDLTGCRMVSKLEGLANLKRLQTLRLARANNQALVNLLAIQDKVVSVEARNTLILNGFFDAPTLIPRMIRMAKMSPRAALQHVLLIISSFARHEGTGPSILLEARVVEFVQSVLVGLQSSSTPNNATLTSPAGSSLASIRKLCFDIIAKMCQNKTSVPYITNLGISSLIADAFRELLPTHIESNGQFAVISETIEHCSSTILFIAAAEGERDRLVQEHPDIISYLVKTLQVGTPEAVAESAGAIWNLAASLRIGAIIADTPGAIASLVYVIQCGSLTAKLQAAGALRNLAIVDSNKRKLFNAGIVQPLAQLCVCRSASLEFAEHDQLEEEKMLVIKAAATLRILATDYQIQGTLATPQLAQTFINLAARDPDVSLRRQVCGIILALSFSSFNRSLLLRVNAVQVLSSLMIVKDCSDSIVASCSGALWNLAAHHEFSQFCFNKKFVADALTRHLTSHSPEIANRAAGALKVLSVLPQ